MRFLVAAVSVMSLVLTMGCNRESGTGSFNQPVATDEHDEHHHEHGPHGSIAFALGGADFKVEAVTNPANNLVQIFILDHAAESNHPLHPIKADQVVVRTDKLGGKSFALKPVSPDANGLTAEYSLDDQTLKSISGMHPTLEITVGEKSYSGELEIH